MTNSEIIRNLELARAALEWEYPLDFCIAIEKAKEIVRLQTSNQKHNAIEKLASLVRQLVYIPNYREKNIDIYQINGMHIYNSCINFDLIPRVTTRTINYIKSINAESLGKTVFTSREEAEQAINTNLPTSAK